MSSKMNHKKRSRYSEQIKGAAFKASSRQAFYRTAYDNHNMNIFGRMAAFLHRKTPQQSGAVKEIAKHQEG